MINTDVQEGRSMEHIFDHMIEEDVKEIKGKSYYAGGKFRCKYTLLMTDEYNIDNYMCPKTFTILNRYVSFRKFLYTQHHIHDTTLIMWHQIDENGDADNAFDNAMKILG